MKKLCVIQHTEAEYLGLIEDHFEGRNVRFIYHRPFTHGGTLPSGVEDYDGLVLLGGGPYGLVSGHILPSISPELKITKGFLDAGVPVLGFELGSVILSVAAGGGALEQDLRFTMEDAIATQKGQELLGLPERFPLSCYLRDMPKPPANSEILASNAAGDPLAFSIGETNFGFVGHPGAKRGMMEDLIMEFVESPDDPHDTLVRLGAGQAEIAENLTGLMVALSRQMGLFEASE
ncbi:MAG: hypothetical protein KDJ19_04075 [Hyphomicrobiaceae bacterium]|nr:hypothetical protein [Hyphomicrobiaceae bacterium]